MAPNFSHRRSLRFKFWVTLGILFLISSLLIGAGYLILYSSFFKVKQIDIQGNNLISSALLKANLISQMLENQGWRSWLGPDNILFWQLGEKPKTIKAIPALKSLFITVNFRERKILLQVKERQLLGIWCLVSQNCYIFDQDGILFSSAPEAEGSLILKIIDQNNRSLQIGQKVLENPEWFKNILIVWDIFQKNGVGPGTIIVNDFSLRQWEIDILGGPKFYFSLDNIPSDLAQILKGLAHALQFNVLQYLDFRVPNRIYYK
ncbi:hypothetical protein COY65_02370 [Candidatus Jorgensenbacteria bacterium CG_4_10_14_0_8_um_filter_39_13]|uniref:POTRA domain-containing protein n=2 Tax=Candidatus Joergenseniibacteriota TaxID=1752739 RepID=A0A2M7RGA4_9BACT|nr:MAG: hypothetical protein COV54_03715 [Candidatus Jorgensenbacteria bacterium CG11_big_fil_rev_8_21_14_0_20_38_23]PIV13178.1 MAG: hypothetical protein COS46_01650 [Candidatus Jorgensenbacteria bacterium CG03_land_8_20_14_0_80_38_39]PIW97724.1 MAG: hypothetical protein COZ81_01020 [Candidatus Jorgensenbacteria bacterium CG_4_8_14_3_um_filter_38_10]PIY95758.1 MAG: hypothetical protein COY65_02370 [Candidatus Jorgensenbacteria bacterium CG_4_10_14_0_8_um_filter_39_13]PJA95238.1 MAG: hypothetica